MNYIKQLNAFYKLLPNNPLSSNAQCLYNYLLNKNNELGWIKEFTVSNMIVCGFTSLNRRTLDRVRNELKQKGYITYEKGVSNQAGKYSIVEFVTQDVTQYVTQDGTQVSHSMTTLNKQNINIYFSLLNKTREKYPKPRTPNEHIIACGYARKQEEWNQLSMEEQLKFISEV